MSTEQKPQISKTISKFGTNGGPATVFGLASFFIAKYINIKFNLDLEVGSIPFAGLCGSITGILQGGYSSLVNFYKMWIWPIIKAKLQKERCGK